MVEKVIIFANKFHSNDFKVALFTKTISDAKDNLLHSPLSSNDCEILQSDITTVAASSTVDSAEEADVIDANDLLADTNLNSEEACRQWIDWLKTPFFYKVILLLIANPHSSSLGDSYNIIPQDSVIFPRTTKTKFIDPPL